MITLWFDWISAQVAARGGVLAWDENTPDLGLTPWFLEPVAESTQFHDFGSQTYEQQWSLGCVWSMGSRSPAEMQKMQVAVRALALAIESGQGRPAAVEAITVGRIGYQPSQEGTAYIVTISLSTVVTQQA